MSSLRRPSPPLLKQQSWSPDTERDEAWTRRKGIHRGRGGQLSRSVTDEDLDELRGCIDLGFGFELGSPADRKLVRVFPALDLCYAVHRSYCDGTVASASSAAARSSSASESDSDGSTLGSPMSIVSPGDTPELVKARLKQWAQVVACSVRQRRC
ncbi:uncharacterized protein M6B38_314310 [Iris pallida]|uniref:Uncharacterized protein n=1 Tax=Iris pallida TaxID=29817 RepID=A0AAX6HEY2_IRIPA|nr:uncharacterized protein M6B38_314310 [Iris pallida]